MIQKLRHEINIFARTKANGRVLEQDAMFHFWMIVILATDDKEKGENNG